MIQCAQTMKADFVLVFLGIFGNAVASCKRTQPNDQVARGIPGNERPGLGIRVCIVSLFKVPRCPVTNHEELITSLHAVSSVSSQCKI